MGFSQNNPIDVLYVWLLFRSYVALWVQIQSLRASVWTLAFAVVSLVGNCLVISVTAYNCCGYKGLFDVPATGCNGNHLDGRLTRALHLDGRLFSGVSI